MVKVINWRWVDFGNSWLQKYSDYIQKGHHVSNSFTCSNYLESLLKLYTVKGQESI